MAERISMKIRTPSPVQMSVPNNTGKFVTYEELAEILREYVSTGDLETALASYATKNELDNDTVMRWGSNSEGGENA